MGRRKRKETKKKDRRPGGRPGRGRGREAPERGRPQYKARPVRKERAGPPVAGPAELGRLLKKYEFPIPKDQLELLARFHALLIDRNRKLNLTRIWNLEDIVVKHYVDCFIITRFLPEVPSPLLDLGTGGGFPGIPLKILLPDHHIILGEGVRKRVDFLREVRTELSLEKLDLIGRNIDRDFEYPVNGVITRAVQPIRDTLKRVRNCLRRDGVVIFMKGPGVDPEKVDAKKKFEGIYEEIDDVAYVLPKTKNRRRLVVYRKVGGAEDDE